MSIDAFPPSIATTTTDDTLDALAGLSTSANTMPYFTGVDLAALTPLTPFMRTLLDDPDLATAQATLGIIGGGGGSTTLLGLTDVPDTYTGQATKVLAVRADETGTEFVTSPVGPTGPQGEPGISAGKILYYAPSDASDIATYGTLLPSPSAGAEQTIATACTGTGDVLVQSFATDPGIPGVVDYPAGTAYRRLYARVSAGVARFHLQVYKRDAGGVEILVRDELSQTFSDTTVTLQEWLAQAPSAGTLSATDRIVNKIYAQRVSGPGTVTVTTYYEGTAHGSHIQTTISTGAQGPPGPQGVPGTPGATTFQALTDAVDYSPGVAGQFVRVNVGGTGLEYVASGASYTDEQAQDAVGAMLVDTATIDLTYGDGGPTLQADVKDLSITEAKLTFVDVTTKDASTTAHGLLRKLSGTATQYLDGSGAWTTPAGAGDTLWTRNPGTPLSLATGLLAFWRMEEASGNRVDSVGGMALVPQGTVGTITNAAGKQGNALAMNGTSGTYLSIADNPALSVGTNQSFTIACWVYVNVAAGTSMAFMSKGAGVGSYGGLEYMLWMFSGDLRFTIGNGAGSFTHVISSTAAVASQWFLLIGWYDAVADIQYIQVNNGTPNQAANALGSHDSVSPVEVGRKAGESLYYLNGRLDMPCFWRRVLTTQERSDVWNGGNGVDYATIVGTAPWIRPTTSTDLVVAGATVATATEPLESAGGLKLGTTTGTTDGTLRWSGTDFEGRKAGAWVSMTAGGGGQPLDATLTALAGLATGADQLPYATGTDTFAQTTLTTFARTLLDDTTQAAMQSTLALVPGTNVQAQDAELQSLAGLTSAADRLPYFTGLGTAALATFTAAGRTLAGAADAAAQRGALALGTMAQQDASAVAITGGSATLSTGSVTRLGVGQASDASYALAVTGAVQIWQDAVVSGTFNVGGGVPNVATRQYIHYTKANQQGLVFKHSDNDTGPGSTIHFENVAGSAVGTIVTTGTTTAYNTTSDHRLKHAITALTGALAVVQALRPVAFRWNSDDSSSEGFLAHELQQVIPAAVSGLPDEVNEDGSIKPQQVDHSRLVPWLTAALQETLAQVQALTERVAYLETHLGI